MSTDLKVQLEHLSVAINESIAQDTFIKLTLSKTRRKEALKNVYVRLIELKNMPHLSFTYRYETKDEVKNYTQVEALSILEHLLQEKFQHAHLFTAQEQLALEISKKGKVRIRRQKSENAKIPTRTHNQHKKRFVPANRPFLKELGISSSEGKVLKAAQGKYKQINKYVEILDGLLLQLNLPETFRIVDMGSGKGYLTFALYDYLENTLSKPVDITGIELRQHLVELCNSVAQQLAFENLQFIAQDIQQFPAEAIDILIALHACDIATDIAIAKGIQSNAQLIVCAPCCHKQIRKAMACSTSLQAILKHGILEERQAELITDGIRALLLEAHGYSTKVFEFISNEHTSKNLMITATYTGKKSEDALTKVEAIKAQFGIEYHYLERLLN